MDTSVRCPSVVACMNTCAAWTRNIHHSRSVQSLRCSLLDRLPKNIRTSASLESRPRCHRPPRPPKPQSLPRAVASLRKWRRMLGMSKRCASLESRPRCHQPPRPPKPQSLPRAVASKKWLFSFFTLPLGSCNTFNKINN